MTTLQADSPNSSLKDILHEDINNDFFPASDTPNQHTNAVIYSITENSPTGLGYTNTGRFPYRSSRGAEYIFTAFIYNENAILVITMRDRTAPSILKAWTTLHNHCKNSGCQPTTYIQDDEFSSLMKNAFHQEQIEYKIVPPHQHGANAAERAIQTFKAHFITCLSGLDPKFPIAEWDRLLRQTELSLNLL